MQIEEHKPLIAAFCCNWCSYAGADLAGNNRLNYPENVKIIRVPCSCRVDPTFILRAFQRGADGVLICGCHPGDCHYTTGNYYTRRRMTLLFSMLEYLGIEKERTRVEWVSAAVIAAAVGISCLAIDLASAAVNADWQNLLRPERR
ncbi:MAG: hydrogenase iron-sulfur subunit, partial [Clostridia bacterium]|nr:hydrogenase iron-sulfur subunit [Clostridia bacterium]